MTAEVIPMQEPPQPKCVFCRKEIPKGALALQSNVDPGKWMCRGCIQQAWIRMGAAA